MANIEVNGGEFSDSFEGLEFSLSEDGKTLTVTNNTDAAVTIVVKGGSDENGGGDGEPVTIEAGGTADVTAPINPNNDQPFGVSNFSICGEENGGEEGEDLVLIKQDLEASTLAGVGFTLGDGDEILTNENGEIPFEDLVEGSYTLTETSNPDEDCETGGTLTVMVSAEGDITVTDDDEADGLAIVSFDSQTNILVLSNDCEGEDTGEEETVEVSIMKHLCTDVATVAEFEAIEAAAAEENPDNAFAPLVATVLACPTIVLTGDVPSEGAVSGGEVDFEFSVLDADGNQLLSEDGTFMQAELCESDVMLDLDGDPEVDACLDVSHYTFEVVDGVVVITETDAPEGHRFGTIRFTPGSDDADALVGSIASVEATGVIRLDTTRDGDDAVMVHAYNFVTEDTQGGETVEVSIMKHLCADVATVAEFEAIEDAGVAGLPGGEGTLSGLAATVLACPTIVLTGDVPTPGAVSSGNVDFDFTVIDSEGNQVLSTDGAFEQAALCEIDVDVDVNEDGDKADCLDTSHYMFEVVDGVVVITETDAPEGHRFGTIRFTPGSDDADALVGSIASVEATGVIRLDTTRDGDDAVMVHAYNFVTEDTQGGGGGGPGGEGTAGGNPLPNTATSPIPTGSAPAALLALLMLGGLGAAGYVVRAEARRRR